LMRVDHVHLRCRPRPAPPPYACSYPPSGPAFSRAARRPQVGPHSASIKRWRAQWHSMMSSLSPVLSGRSQ
jgi:hypothetical protein